MELYQLQYFVAVVEEKSFTRAAARCHISQPALSQQMQKLERECGTKLLERRGRVVRPTPAGETLYRRACELLRLAATMYEEVHQHGAYGCGRVSLGAIPTVSPYLLPPLISRFCRQFPRAELSVHEDLTENLLDACRVGELDLAILADPVDEPGLRVEPLFAESLLVALRSDHPLSRKRSIALSDLEREPFVLVSELHCLGRQILELCTQAGYTPMVRCRSAQLLTVQRLVRAGLGVSLVPEMAAKADRVAGVVYKRVTRPQTVRTLVLVRPEHRLESGAVLALQDAILTHCQKLPGA